MFVLRWDPCGICCVLLSYVAILYADYVVIFWLVVPTFDGSLWSCFHVVNFNTIVLLMLVAHCRAMLSDPGMVPLSSIANGAVDLQQVKTTDRCKDTGSTTESDSDGSANDVQQQFEDTTVGTGNCIGDDWTICGRCEVYRPPRAHHCRVCQRCVRKMDHHCPWINNCVGEFNQKYFLQFLIYVAAASVYCIGLVLAAWLWDECLRADLPTARSCRHETRHHAKVLHTIFVTIESALFCLFVAAVTCDQLTAIFNDQTAVEQVQKRGSFRSGKSRRSLLKDVCGPGPVCFWLLPCTSQPNRILEHNQRLPPSQRTRTYDV